MVVIFALKNIKFNITTVNLNSHQLLQLKGDIDLREVSNLTSKLNVPGGDLLKNADKKLNKKNK